MRLSVVRVTTGWELPITVVTTSATVLATRSCSGGTSGSWVLGAVLSEPSEGVDRVIQRPGISERKGDRNEHPFPQPLPLCSDPLSPSSQAPSLFQVLLCPAVMQSGEGWDCVHVIMVHKTGLGIRRPRSPFGCVSV